jgi:hypothetical protein
MFKWIKTLFGCDEYNDCSCNKSKSCNEDFKCGVAIGLHAIYSVLNRFLEKDQETIEIYKLRNAILSTIDANDDHVKNMFYKMLEYDKESKDENKQ